MNFSPLLLPAAATLAAAGVAACAALVVTILTKENKISEMRQEWINSLREEIADFVAEMQLIHLDADTTFDDKKSAEYLAWYETYKTQGRVALGLMHRINLRLNTKDHAVLIGHIQRLEDTVDKFSEQTPNPEHHQIVKLILDEARLVLKTEWTRVKQGEKAFVLVKTAAKVISVVAVLCSLAAIAISFVPPLPNIQYFERKNLLNK